MTQMSCKHVYLTASVTWSDRCDLIDYGRIQQGLNTNDGWHDCYDARFRISAFRCQHETALAYLSAELSRMADADPGKQLRSAKMAALVIP